MSTQRIIIGVDFGTTYSGVAWANSNTPRDIIPIRQWPDAVGKQDVDKVPSEMAYLPDGSFKWGFQATAESVVKEANVLQYMKLLLDPSQEQNSDLADPLGLTQMRESLPPGKEPMDVVADYLAALRMHALDVLSKTYGTEFWKVIPIEYHLTIPAVWSDAAKALTLQAANKAGIGSKDDLVLIAEPEAAALYCLTDLYPDLLKVGDTFVVVDCGGGTVDLISYKVLNRSPRFEVKEVAVGGGLCGSVFLNRRFESFARKRLGLKSFEKMYAKGKPYRKMMKEFDERLKRTFKDSLDQDAMDCEVPGVPDDPTKKIEDGFLEIERAEMQGIFEPVIREILRLVQEQLDSVRRDGHSSVASVLLVGGFGSSPYLYKRVEAALNVQDRKIKVLQPANAWSAVVRGAVICGLQSVDIKSRHARRNYGIAICQPFDAARHPAKDKIFCPQELRYYCTNRMKWYVKKDDEVAATQKFAFNLYQTFDVDTTDFEVIEGLLASNSPRNLAEEDSKDPNVYKLCSIKYDLSELRKHFIRRTNQLGNSYYTISYCLVMYIHSAQLTFKVEHDGVQYGAATTVTFY